MLRFFNLIDDGNPLLNRYCQKKDDVSTTIAAVAATGMRVQQQHWCNHEVWRGSLIIHISKYFNLYISLWMFTSFHHIITEEVRACCLCQSNGFINPLRCNSLLHLICSLMLTRRCRKFRRQTQGS